MSRLITLVAARAAVLAVLAARRPRAGQAERRHDHRGSGVDRPRGRRRQDHRRVDRQGLSGSALRRGQAELHPQAAEGRPADRRRPRAGDRLAAAADPAEPQRQDPGRRATGYLDASLRRDDPRDPDRPGHARDGRRPSARQPALLARSGERQARSPRRSPTSCRELRPGRRARTSSSALADFDDAARRGARSAGWR